MKMSNLKDLMISITDFKKELAEIVNRKETKVIMKNNDPVSVIMPYSDYAAMTGKLEDTQQQLKGLGHDIILINGVSIMVCVATGTDSIFGDNVISIKVYTKMKTSGEYKLHYTLHLNPPNKEQTLTTEELVEYYKGNFTFDEN